MQGFEGTTKSPTIQLPNPKSSPLHKIHTIAHISVFPQTIQSPNQTMKMMEITSSDHHHTMMQQPQSHRIPLLVALGGINAAGDCDGNSAPAYSSTHPATAALQRGELMLVDDIREHSKRRRLDSGHASLSSSSSSSSSSFSSLSFPLLAEEASFPGHGGFPRLAYPEHGSPFLPLPLEDTVLEKLSLMSMSNHGGLVPRATTLRTTASKRRRNRGLARSKPIHAALHLMGK